MKKISAIAIAALLAGSAVGGPTAYAQEEPAQVISTQEDTTNYMKFTGVVKEIESGAEEIRLTIENEDELIMILRINDDSLLFNSGTTDQLTKADMKKGATVEGYYDKNKPMILIYPATVIPELVIVKDEDVFGDVKVGKFDKDFLSLDKTLKLNIADDTILLNQQGEDIEKQDLQGKELVVFYTATMESLPPQTAPTKIIVLDYATDEMEKVQQIIAADHYMKDGVRMIPLRKVAEQLGYTVQSQPKVNGALVTLKNRSFTITRGDKTYGYNKSIRSFEVAPELKGMKTYVSEDFLELLIQN